MNKEKFKKGDVLYHKTHFNEWIIVYDKHDGDTVLGCEKTGYIKVNDSGSYVKNTYNNTTTKELRKATIEEIKWLEACKKAGMFVPKPIKEEIMVSQENFFIKYTPEITPEIFEILSKKLNLLYGDQFEHCGLGTDYETFKSKKYIVHSNTRYNKKGWCIDNNDQYTINEKYYSEFVKEKPFVLPKKWCIKDTKEVGEFFESYNFGNYSLSGKAYLHYPYFYKETAVDGRSCYDEKIQPGYTEITIDQFQEHVLKNVKEDKWYIVVTESNRSVLSDYFHKIGPKHYKGYSSTWKINTGNKVYFPQYESHCWSHTSSISTKPGYREMSFEEFKEKFYNPSDFVEKPKYKVVHCTTQEQWDFVRRKINSPELSSEWKEYKQDSCLIINIEDEVGYYSTIEFFKRNPSIIYSFEEWAKIYEIPMNDLLQTSSVDFVPKIGDYITILGKNQFLGKTGVIKYTSEYEGKYDSIRCEGPSISDFCNSTGDFTFKSQGGFCFKHDDRTYRKSTLEEIQWLDICIKQNSFVPKDYFYKKGPRFNVGDEVKICSKEEDVNGWGYLGYRDVPERIVGLAGRKAKITEIKIHNGRNYYKIDHYYISEDCLIPVNVAPEPSYKIPIVDIQGKYTGGYDPYLVEEMKTFSESYKTKQSPKNKIDECVNKVKSVEVKLIQPKKVVYF